MLIKGKRRGLSAEQKAELWKRWKAGQSLNEIGRALGKDEVSAISHLSCKAILHYLKMRHAEQEVNRRKIAA